LAAWSDLRARLFEPAPDVWERRLLIGRIIQNLYDKKNFSCEKNQRKRAS
jgi:hypothetical protein